MLLANPSDPTLQCYFVFAFLKGAYDGHCTFVSSVTVMNKGDTLAFCLDTGLLSPIVQCAPQPETPPQKTQDACAPLVLQDHVIHHGDG